MHPIVWILVGAGGYWALQHFTGVGKTGKPRQAAS